ncbi:hypothetical protein CCYA_CCYA19G4665 [Cyanidiococcus yangmingshanensis]|uniref:Uncharacterized protein n=1 Tax=Cyanidiococcus yangmingshanensis TaxID=2690220 RepID=A0A7J7ID00_9RHOD|nr:hypothetical protein F1559_001950 [Cyanidiococcus yangmingshanensis]KAK4533783.1 hypothetical protein CCYA_CCYA19G4665 [Cyanidiococcus yangmingshanensis]
MFVASTFLTRGLFDIRHRSASPSVHVTACASEERPPFRCSKRSQPAEQRANFKRFWSRPFCTREIERKLGDESARHDNGEGLQLLGVIPLVPNWLVWILYFYFGYRFYRGYDRTTFSSSSKLMLTLVWPVLLITASGRRNFQRALRGDDS